MKLSLFCVLLLPVVLSADWEEVPDGKTSEDGLDERISSATIRLRNRLFGKRKHRTICSPDNDENNAKKLREIIRGTDFVFTGTVVGVPSKTRSSRRVRLRKKKKKV